MMIIYGYPKMCTIEILNLHTQYIIFQTRKSN